MPLVIRGNSSEDKTFLENAFAISICAHGALVVLATEVALGQRLLLVNLEDWNERKVRVARVASFHGRVAQVGLEFEQPGFEFWPASALPLRASGSR